MITTDKNVKDQTSEAISKKVDVKPADAAEKTDASDKNSDAPKKV